MAAASARLQLDAGVLAIREPGGPAGSSSGIGPDAGLPRLVTAGSFLAPAGGYLGFQRVTSADELAAAAVDELSRSSGWAKVVMDWMDPQTGRLTPNYPLDAMIATAAAVHEAGGRLAAHVALPESIEICIEARVDSIEHGLSVGPDHAAAMADLGIAFTPTAVGMQGVPDFLAGIGVPDEEVAWWTGVVERFPQTVRQAAEAGVRILAGTDAGMGPHGEIRREIDFLRDAGLSAQQALGAGSWDAREFLGFPGIEPGAPADLVAFVTDPREDLQALAQPKLIVLDGQVMKGP
jgi:imidazolonepropionase-like amidohydrolase